MTYAGFWHRLGAGAVDALVFAPLCILSFWAIGESATVAVLVSSIVSGAYYAYSIVGHAVWGQTIGKRIAGIRVRSLDGAPISWRVAVRRSSVDIAIGVLATIGYAVVLFAIPETDFSTKGWQQISEQYDRARPTWVRVIEYGYWVWLAGEVFTVLLNPRRRAIHDFIGGTVVVIEGRAFMQLPVVPATSSKWAKSWAAIDYTGALLGFVIAAAFVLGAIYSASIADDNAFTGTLMIASYGFVVSVLFALARRAAWKGRTRHSWLRGAAVVMVALPVLLLIWGSSLGAG
jgi:uncharacterized RDD family membrane protein YckC